MMSTRRAVVMLGSAALLLLNVSVGSGLAGRLSRVPVALAAGAQEQAPTRREITLTAKNYRFSPSRIEVAQDDLVKLTVQSQDVAYSFTIEEYRVSRRVPAGGTTTVEFRADRTGTFSFYSNLTNDARHAQMKGELIVRGR